MDRATVSNLRSASTELLLAPAPTGFQHVVETTFLNILHLIKTVTEAPLSMWETRAVQLNVRLPRDIAAQAEEVQDTDPEFLSRET